MQPLIAIIGNIGFLHDGTTLYVRVMVPGRRDAHVVHSRSAIRTKQNAYERARYVKRKALA